ncbi:MAG: UDP-2,3-diacylglucosamine diphosphatase [Gammaproteobacteria bacterium]|jgi:UDP-2,3-diacylglucosamine hydrolase
MTGLPVTLFVSDLHLDPERPATTQLFLEFLGQRACQADALYILGDLFEAWIGDDDDTAMNHAVIRGLRACAESGTPLFVMHGNRDFLLGEEFARQSRCTLLDDPTRIDLYGTPTLLMHGDLLCTDDREYMQFRAMVHDPRWQADMLSRPLAERRQIAADMRRTSREQNSGKPESIMDVNPGAVIDIMTASQVTRLIHGHTHRPAIHDPGIPETRAQRIVLGDWYSRGSVLECTRKGCDLRILDSVRPTA